MGDIVSSAAGEMHAGILVGEVLARHGVRHLFTLCGGHISPILIGAEEQGVRVIDVRHEATAVFAADGLARLSGVPGVAAVTAGPGLTNTITAVKNAQMAQSPVVLLGGATATLLKGRGSLQDIDQMALVRPHVKWAVTLKKVADIVPMLEEGLRICQSGVPGPVFLELPVDLLYPHKTVRAWTLDAAGRGDHWTTRLFRRYLDWHVGRVFRKAFDRRAGDPQLLEVDQASEREVARVVAALEKAARPVLIIGSQATLNPPEIMQLQAAVLKLGIPTYLSGMARGLLGKDPLHMRHKRSKAIREADCLLLAGVPSDFRLGYGRIIRSGTTYIDVNRSRKDLFLNKQPDIPILADPGDLLRRVGERWQGENGRWVEWHASLQARDAARDAEIRATASQDTKHINPVLLCHEIEAVLPENSVLIGDGGDFVATASYIVRPRRPLSWLDPGAFGTLGAGAGFALAAKLHRPEAEVWLLYGDGSAGYSLAEFDTFARHSLPIVAIVGTDGAWSQIAREQVEIFGTPLGTELARTPYHLVAQGYGGEGLLVQQNEDVPEALETARSRLKAGRPTLVNAWIGATDFRKGSISM